MKETTCWYQFITARAPENPSEYKAENNEVAGQLYWDITLPDLFNDLGGDILKLGVDDLPEHIKDIRGLIHNEPTRVFAIDNGADEDVEYFGLAEFEMTEKQELLYNNSLDWYVVTLENGDLELKHQTSLSAILECGQGLEDFGCISVERCWNREYFDDEA